MMQTAAETILRMQEAVPPGRACLTNSEWQILGELTQKLLTSRPGAREEYDRFLSTSHKSIDLPGNVLEAYLSGKRIMVTGGTGCVGSALLAQLARFHPARMVSVSRGITQGRPRVPGAEYVQADIRDINQLATVFGAAGYDVVFHVAGQRDPGLAEAEVSRTVTTNVLGTENVINVAAAVGIPQVVSASTGKALRPYSSEVYTASKRVAEWLLSRAVARGQAACSAVRFTHVIDNSIIHARLLNWCDGGIIRLHGADIAFYVQSATQSAQLLLTAAAAPRDDRLRIHAITDLGWPVSLLDVALGAVARTGSPAPIYFGGYERGYETMAFPGLYDPATAGDVSPLLSMFEAPGTQRSWCPEVDMFPLQMASGCALDEQMQALTAVCARTEEPGPLRAALDELSWSLLDATLSAVPREVLARSVRLSRQHHERLTPSHERMLAAIEHFSATAGPVVVAGGEPAVAGSARPG